MPAPGDRGADVMLGAIIGDIVGSVYEWNGIKTVDFPFWSDGAGFTDDTVMTVACADALMHTMGRNPGEVRAAVIERMQYWGRKYPHVGYGSRFEAWLWEDVPRPYYSWGNGSAMRVSAAGWLYDTMEQTTAHARYTAEVSHNHPEGIRGAAAVAAAVFLLRNGKSKREVKSYVQDAYGYDLSGSLEEIRPAYRFDVSCRGSVPPAFLAFFESSDFESAIRNAVSLGGDSDTQAAIAGSLGEAHYGIPPALREKALTYLDDEMKEVYNKFYQLTK